MKWLSLLLIIVIKIVLDKGLMSGLILLSVLLKGSSIKNLCLNGTNTFFP